MEHVGNPTEKQQPNPDYAVANEFDKASVIDQNSCIKKTNIHSRTVDLQKEANSLWTSTRAYVHDPGWIQFEVNSKIIYLTFLMLGI